MDTIRYITTVDNAGIIKKIPKIEEFKGKEVEIIIQPHINKKKIKMDHKKLRKSINPKGKPLSNYVINDRNSSR